MQMKSLKRFQFPRYTSDLVLPPRFVSHYRLSPTSQPKTHMNSIIEFKFLIAHCQWFSPLTTPHPLTNDTQPQVSKSNLGLSAAHSKKICISDHLKDLQSFNKFKLPSSWWRTSANRTTTNPSRRSPMGRF